MEASWARLRGQDSSKLASQIEGKSIKNPCKNQSKIRCLPSSNFDAFLMDFWRENGGMLAPKSDQKSMSTSKGRFYKSIYKTNGILMIFVVLGAEVGRKNRSKIDQKMEARRGSKNWTENRSNMANLAWRGVVRRGVAKR